MTDRQAIVEVMARALFKLEGEVTFDWRDYAPDAQAALAALDAAGYRVVPVEPTDAMIRAGIHATAYGYDIDRDDFSAIWAAMLAASQGEKP